MTLTLIDARFSLDVEVYCSTPVRPFRFCSILFTTPSSISSGDAPGYTAVIVMSLLSTRGKKVVLSFPKLIQPKKKKPISKASTPTGYFMKNSINLFIGSLFHRSNNKSRGRLQTRFVYQHCTLTNASYNYFII